MDSGNIVWLVISLIIWGGTAWFKRINKAKTAKPIFSKPASFNDLTSSSPKKTSSVSSFPSFGKAQNIQGSNPEISPFFSLLEVFTGELRNLGADHVSIEEDNRTRFDHYKIKKKKKNTFADFLDDKDSFKKAFILSEILKRPEY